MNTLLNRRLTLKSFACVAACVTAKVVFGGALASAADDLIKDDAKQDAAKDDEGYRPHTPTLVYYLSNVTSQADADAIVAAVQKLPSVRKVKVYLARSYAQVRFDSHVVSYHQVAQTIADAGTKVGKKFEPRLKIRVPEYSQGDNAAKVDAVLAGKRLNQRVRIEPLDKKTGEFFVYLLPLKLDPDATGPQGFNGGHLNHPLHDPPPRGLGLTCIYAAEDEGGAAVSK